MALIFINNLISKNSPGERTENGSFMEKHEASIEKAPKLNLGPKFKLFIRIYLKIKTKEPERLY